MKNRLMEDLKKAMKNKDTLAKDTIQGIRAEILKEEKDKQKVLDNCEIENIIMKEKRKRLDLLNQLENTNREDIKQQTVEELDIISQYLPRQLTREEIEQEVNTYMKPLVDVTVREMGSIIKDLKQRLGNSVDGKVLSEVVRERITK